MSSPILRRITLIIIRSVQAVSQYTAFVFRSPRSPIGILTRSVFRIVILPIYQVLHRLKRVARKQERHIASLLLSEPLFALVIGISVIVVVIMNLTVPRTARSDTVGQKTILFALASDIDLAQEETIIVTPRKHPPRSYTSDQRTLLWRMAAPLDRDEDILPLETRYSGGTIVTSGLPGTAPGIPDTTRRESIVYRVQPGDTLGTIAERFNVSVETLLWENNLRITALLRLGQELRILPVSGVAHIVARGDTPASIARRYGVTVADIASTNGLSGSMVLSIGQRIVIPGGRRVFATPAPTRLTPLRTQFTIPGRPVTGTGRLFWPTTSRKLNQYFTWRHGGIDIDGDYTSPVYAADEGKVTVSGWGRGYGIHIDIDHGNGLVTRYGHNSKNFVRVGERVKRGQLIGMVGSTGRSTGPHIHFEVLISGRRTNPLNYVR